MRNAIKLLFIVGSTTILSITTSFAQGWSRLESGTTAPLYHVCFTDANTGSAVGWGGLIIHTTDGGTSWSRKIIKGIDFLACVHFVNKRTGTAVGSPGAILRTTDSGETWAHQVSGTQQCLRGVFFTAADSGIAVGDSGTILRTVDGGLTWTPGLVPVRSQLMAITLMTRRTGLAVGRDAILKTTDAGATWRVIPSYGDFRAVSFTDSSTGLVAGNFYSSGIILRTTDAGETWHMPTMAGEDQRYLGVSFPTPRHAAAVGYGPGIVHSTDGGQSWFRPLMPGTASPLWSVSFVDSNTGYAVGNTGDVLATTIGGAPVTLIAPGDGSATAPERVQFLWHKSILDTFHIQISTTKEFFGGYLYDNRSLLDTTLRFDRLSYNTTYYWRVQGRSSRWVSPWTAVWTFTTSDYPEATIRSLQAVPEDSLLLADRLQESLPWRWTLQSTGRSGDTVTITAVCVVPVSVLISPESHSTIVVYDTSTQATSWRGIHAQARGEVPAGQLLKVREGDLVKLSGFPAEYPAGSMNSNTVFNILDIRLLAHGTAPPAALLTPRTFYEGEYPGGRVLYSSGEQYEGMIVEFRDLAVRSYKDPSSGTFTMTDSKGTLISTSDASRWFTLRDHRHPASRYSLPPLRSHVTSIRGLIIPDAVGDSCRGYTIAPVHPEDLVLGFRLASINGRLFNDSNQNRLEDPGERGLANWRIDLGGKMNSSCLTDSLGDYSFTRIDSGTYTITPRLPPGWLPSPGADDPITLTLGIRDSFTGEDFPSYYYFGSISGMVYNDVNLNTKRDEGEPALIGWQVVLAGKKGTTVLTDSSGAYVFTPLDTGTYRISEGVQAGWRPSPPGDSSLSVVVDLRDSLSGRDFPTYYHMSTGNTVSGKIIFDRNENRVIEADEQPLSNWLLRLWGPKVDSTLSDTAGRFSFGVIPPGTYRVSAGAREGWEQSFPAGFYTITFRGFAGEQTGADFALHHLHYRIRIPLTISDSTIVAHRQLSLGIRPGASYGLWRIDRNATVIDSLEGEFEIPPKIYPIIYGFFDARFEDPRLLKDLFGEGGWTDIRDYISVAQADTYLVSFVPARSIGGDYPMRITWPKEQIRASFNGPVRLLDQFGGVTDMKATDSVIIADKHISSVRIISQSPNLPTLLIKQWNMVSIPSFYGQAEVKTLFPTAVSPAFSWRADSGFRAQPSLMPGTGYWLKCSLAADTTLLFNRGGASCDTIDVHKGWNIVGSPALPAEVAATQSIPPGILDGGFEGYTDRYSFADTLMPYRAYWVKANADGKLVLNSYGAYSGLRNDPSTRAREALAQAGTLTFRDAEGRTQTLYFSSGKSTHSVDHRYFELPPVPPPGMFDARFTSNTLLETAADSLIRECPISISTGAYPLKVFWEPAPRGAQSVSLKLGDREIPLGSSGALTIERPQISIVLSLGALVARPRHFALLQNYPNPFNPSTTIRFDIPEDRRVKLTLYDILGREIRRLVDGPVKAGYHVVNFDGSSLPSGVYFYRMEAGEFMSVKKMILVR